MILKKITPVELKHLSEKRKIIAYGAGMVAHHIQDVLCRTGIDGNILFFADRDDSKAGTFIKSENREYEVRSIKELYKDIYADSVLMITCENSERVFRQLEQDKCIKVRDVVLYEDINRRLMRKAVTEDVKQIKKQETAPYIIPPMIHYCWFGENDIPEWQQEYMEEWKKKYPEYEFCLWNESNYDISCCRYVKEAYEAGKYAFVSDYVRMDVVYRYGGIYLDTDVKPAGDINFLRKYKAFFGYGKWPSVASGTGFGGVKGCGIIREMRDNPRGRSGFVPGRTNIYYEAPVMKDRGFVMDFSTQIKDDICLLSPKYFPPVNYLEEYEMPEEAVALHMDAGSWKK